MFKPVQGRVGLRKSDPSAVTSRRHYAGDVIFELHYEPVDDWLFATFQCMFREYVGRDVLRQIQITMLNVMSWVHIFQAYLLVESYHSKSVLC